MPQLGLGHVYPLVARLDDPDDLREVVLGGRRLLCRCVCSYGVLVMAHRTVAEQHTQRDVVIRLHGHVLPYLELVYGLEDGEPVAHAIHAQLLQLGMLQRSQHIARDAFVCQ
jgi:hypothetical protein